MAGAVRRTPKDADGPKPGHKHSALYLALYKGTATGTMSRISENIFCQVRRSGWMPVAAVAVGRSTSGMDWLMLILLADLLLHRFTIIPTALLSDPF